MRDRAGERSFFEFEVSRPVTLHSRQQAPQAPSTRDSAFVQFVVDTTGLADNRTLLFLGSPGDGPTPEFRSFVKSLVAAERFTPATYRETCLVRQFVQQPIVVR